VKRKRSPALLVALAVSLSLLSVDCAKTVSSSLTDATITTRVKTALLNAPGLNAVLINVETSGGVVHLSGEVRSPAEADRAVDLARGVDGVMEVKSTLQVQKGVSLAR
jgi:osmotically-inducible protein OsmY